MMMKISTEISRNGILSSRSWTATIEDPCCDHGGDYGDNTEAVYDALQDAWEDREEGSEEVTVVIGDDTFCLYIAD